MEKILIVEAGLASDERVLRFLEREGYEVLTAKDGQEGVRMLQAAQPSVAMVDHHLGAQDALELLKEFRETNPLCEVILITPGGEMDVAIEALRAGALDYLRRPVDLEQLGIALGRAKERRQHRRVPEPAVLLVLEDHEPTRRRLAQTLEKEGYHVRVGADGQEGAELLQESRIDLVIADLRMPRKDGLSLLHETRASGIDVEFIVMTGYGDEEVVVQALRDGAINFLRKPLDIDQMLLAIQKALEHQTTRRSLAYRNRDIELMQELVVRLTRKLEIIVETPGKLSDNTLGFLHQLVDALPLGLVVVGADRRILYANRHVVEKTGPAEGRLTPEYLRPIGIAAITQEALDAAFETTMGARLGTIETLMLTSYSFLVMTPLTLLGPSSAERYVALVIRGERRPSGG